MTHGYKTVSVTSSTTAVRMAQPGYNDDEVGVVHFDVTFAHIKTIVSVTASDHDLVSEVLVSTFLLSRCFVINPICCC
jgi:hypothetical protein